MSDDAPDWFQPPESEVIERPRRSMFSGQFNRNVPQVIGDLHRGDLALPPWQRSAVWTEDQRIKLLDSIIRGVSIGAITLWTPPHGDNTERVAFDGCDIVEFTALVIDGQQRLTTLLMAARGDLDHWRWNGREWTTGKGFTVPSMAVDRWRNEFFGWVDGDDGRRMCADLEAMLEHEITFMRLDGSAADMVKTYRRLATCGTPHSIEDLAVLERWLAGER